MSFVRLNDVGKIYPKSESPSVEEFNLEIKKGEFIVFVGPSGCGKSTTLRMIAGLEEISLGEVIIDDVVVNNVHPKERDIAMVFQNYALYPHMTVYDNIAFGLKLRKTDKVEIEEKVNWAAEVLGLENFLDRKPKDLSGGQRQRVALGRAIVRNPKVFLMDEPLSNLDAKLRGKMRNEITKLHRELKATTIYVTHDQIEAMTMADRIVVMSDGNIQQIGTPIDLYERPKNLFVASFIGAPQMNFVDVHINEGFVIFSDGNKIKITDKVARRLKNSTEKVTMGIRPEHIKYDEKSLEILSDQIVTEEVNSIENMGHELHVFTKVSTVDIILRIPFKIPEKIGDQIKFAIDIDNCHFFDIESGDSCLEFE